MYIHTIVASVLFKTQLLHETRHFVQSSLALDYSFEVSFFIVPFSSFENVYRLLVVWVMRVFYASRKEAES